MLMQELDDGALHAPEAKQVNVAEPVPGLVASVMVCDTGELAVVSEALQVAPATIQDVAPPPH